MDKRSILLAAKRERLLSLKSSAVDLALLFYTGAKRRWINLIIPMKINDNEQASCR